MLVRKLFYLPVALLLACGGAQSEGVSIELRTQGLDASMLTTLKVVLHPPERACAQLAKEPTKHGISEVSLALSGGEPKSGEVRFERLNDQQYRVIAIASSASGVLAFGCADELVTATAGKLSSAAITLTDWTP